MEKFCHRGGRRGIDTFLKPDQIHVKVLYIKAENFKCIFSSHSLTASEQIRRFCRSVGWKLQHRRCGKIWRGAVIVSSVCAYLLNPQVLVCGLNNYNQLGVAEVKCFVAFLMSSCLQGLTFYMPVESRDLSSHSWGGIAIGQHHAIGQVWECCGGS